MADVFDEYVSLGCDCEGGFQIRRVLGADSSNFFNWNITPIAALDQLLRHRFDGILKEENISVHGDGGLLNDHAYGYKFHSPFGRPDYANDPDYAARWAEFRRKADYLIGKFLRDRPAGHRTAYFYKATADQNPASVRPGMVAVRDILSALHGESQFALVVLQPASLRDADWGEHCLHNRYLHRIAPWHDAADGHVPSWDMIFREFPHREPMRTTHYG